MTDQQPSDPKTYDKLSPQPDAKEDTVSTDDKQHEEADDDSVTLSPIIPDRPATVPSNNENQLPQPSVDPNDDQQQEPNYDQLQPIQQYQPKTVATTEPVAGHKPTDDQQQSGSDNRHVLHHQPVQQQQHVNFQPQPTDDNGGKQLPEQPPPVYDKLQPAVLNPVPVSHDNSTMHSKDGQFEQHNTPQAGFVPPQSGAGYNTTTVTTSPAQVTVYTQQPTPIWGNSYRTGDHYLVLSVFNTFFCCIFGGWITLLCTIPAILYSLNAQSAEAAGQFDEMNANERISLNLNMAAIFSYFVLWSLYLVIVVVTVSTTT